MAEPQAPDDPVQPFHPNQEPDVRFSLANERTLLAYQRTAIALIATAVAVVHFFEGGWVVGLLALSFLLAAGFAAIGGYLQFRRVERAIREGYSIGPGPAVHALGVTMVVCLLIAVVYVVLEST